MQLIMSCSALTVQVLTTMPLSCASRIQSGRTEMVEKV